MIGLVELMQATNGSRNSEFGVRMSEHPKSSSEVKNDWLVEAMHATVGSRNAEWCYASAEWRGDRVNCHSVT